MGWHDDQRGRFPGDIDLPDEVNPSPQSYIRGDMFLATTTDDAGTILVKRYRLVLPGE